jgi:cytochrome c oxidase subunit 2
VTVANPLPPPITDQADDLESIWNLFVVLGAIVFVFVLVLLLYVIVRYRRRDDQLPRQKHYNIPVEVTYTVIPFLIVVALVGITFVSVNAIDDADDQDPDLVVDVTAFQWQWEFRYPDTGVAVVGGPGDELPELVLPADRTVRFELQSLDVIHSFWITAFRFKRDVIPGNPSSFTVDIGADAAGHYPNAGVCAEYCGLDHAFMNFEVRVLEPAEFDQWISERAVTGAET